MPLLKRWACVVVNRPVHDAAHEALRGLTNDLEVVDFGAFLLDCEPFGDAEAAQAVIRTAIQSSAPVQVGIAGNRFTAEQAARISGIVPPGKERTFLAPLDVRRLPLSAEMERRLIVLGLRTLGDLAALPKAALVNQFGKEAAVLYEMARGRDPRPLRPDAAPLQIDRAAKLLDPSGQRTFIRQESLKLVVEIAAALTQHGYQAEVLRLTLHTEDGQTLAYDQTLKPPTADPERLLWLASRLLERCGLAVPISRIVVTAYPMRSWHLGVQQMTMFQTSEEVRQRQLDEVVRQIRRRFGTQALITAAEMPPPQPVPVNVHASPQGRPLRVRLTYGLRQVVDLIEHWQEERGWGETEQHRDYFQVVLDGAGAVRTVFRNMLTGRWYIDRVTRLL